MPKTQPPAKPLLGESGRAEAEKRRQRQAEALRENLRKRKAQDQRRETALPSGEESEIPDCDNDAGFGV